MRWIESLLLALLVILTPNVYLSAQVAGSTSLGVTAEELRAVAVGWSAKKQVLGKTVYNENKEKVGAIDDLIIAPDRAVSFAIIGAGGFVGLGRHDVAIPVDQFPIGATLTVAYTLQGDKRIAGSIRRSTG